MGSQVNATVCKAHHFPPEGVCLSRKEAEMRLHHIEKGCEEYQQLQHALVKTSGIVEIVLKSLMYKVNCMSTDEVLQGGFGSSEHVAIGEEVDLKGLTHEYEPILIMKGSARVRFQHIVALAGDFYGIYGEAVSLPGGTDEEKEARFKKAFETLENADNTEVEQLLSLIKEECEHVKHSGVPHHCYTQHLMVEGRKAEKIKAGYNDLLIDNSDHFSIDAKETYRIGHTLALKTAKEAGRKKNVEGLKKAYAIDAFACHFLTDLFAAGHIRNQRGALEKYLISLGFEVGKEVFQLTEAKTLAGILTAAQHQKDGDEGLEVEDGSGDCWKAYGDGNFFSTKNEKNKQKAIQAVQASVDEVYQSYSDPNSANFNRVYQKNIPEVKSSNPKPLYSVSQDTKVLTLHHEGHEIEIKSKEDFLQKGVLLALKNLPPNYVDDTISGLIKKHITKPIRDEMHPWVRPIFSPTVLSHAQDVICKTLGVASHYQVEKESRMLSKEIEEMADELKRVTDKILEKVEFIAEQVEQLSLEVLLQPIQKLVRKIQVESQLMKDEATYIPKTLEKRQDNLWETLEKLHVEFTQPSNTQGKMLTSLYATMVKDISPEDVPQHNLRSKLSEKRKRLVVTSWLRKLIEHQIGGFALYVTIDGILSRQHNAYKIRNFEKYWKDPTALSEDGRPMLSRKRGLVHKIDIFKQHLEDQINLNESNIDKELVNSSLAYIELEFEKFKIELSMAKSLKNME
jgi:hypothetical protein